MAKPRGVLCPNCGASTPLPDDLRVPTFSCAFCHAQLDTARLAGTEAVSADAFVGHMDQALKQALENPGGAFADAHAGPRFEGGSRDTRSLPCRHCGALLVVPLDLSTRTVSCAGCQREELINTYIPDDERFKLDMQRQIAGNAALAKLQVEGMPCGRCGAANPVPDDGRVQVVCAFCGAAILLSDHVDPSAVARNRLKHGVFGVRDDMMAKSAAKQKRVNLGIGVFIAVVMAGFVVANLLLAP